MKTLKYAARFLIRAKSYTLINLLGLAFSLACCIILMRYIHRELTVDTHCVDREKVYAICKNLEGNLFLTELYKNAHDTVYIDPRHIEYHTSYTPLDEDNIYLNGHSIVARTIVTDSVFFQLFHYPLKQGKISLDNPQSALMTESFARKVFGNENPIGKVFRHSRAKDLIIEGILKEPDCKSTLQFDVVLSAKLPRGLFSRIPTELYSFLPGTDMDVMNGIGKKPRYENSPQWDTRQYTFSFMPIKEIYWHGELTNSEPTMFLSGKQSHIWILSAVCFLLFMSGILNFINLYLTTMLTRGKEYGLRKVFGANLLRMFMHIYTENLLLIVSSLLVAWLFVEISMIPTEQILDMPYKYTWFDAWLSIGILIILPFVASIYPFFKYCFNSSVKSLRNLGWNGNSIRSRMFLLGIQYALTFLITVSALYYNQQLSLLVNTEPGFRTKNILVANLLNEDLIEIDPNKNFHERYLERKARTQSFLNELKACPYIETMDGGMESIITPCYQITFSNESGKKVLMYLKYISPAFFETFGIQLIEGSLPTEWEGTQRNQVVLNRAALEALGYHSMKEAFIIEANTQRENANAVSHTILAIAEDYYGGHLTMGKEPIVYMIGEGFSGSVFQIAYKDGKEKELLEYLSKLSEKVYGIKDFKYTFLEDDVKALYEEDCRIANIYTVFAFIAIAISCLGLFGISLFDIRRRYREIGIRKVNGAKIKDLYRLLFRKYVVVLVAAFVVAIPIAYYLITLYTQDFVVKAPIGIGIFIIALLVVSIISLGTLFWQVHKAANINPADVVKSE